MTANKRTEGIGHQVKGAVMESLGVAVGDATRDNFRSPACV
jgi:uncharacterized protein YjbJ (UPF0337 family)